MAFDLTAVLRLNDQYTDRMRRVAGETKKFSRVVDGTSSVTDRLARSGTAAGAAFSRLSSSASRTFTGAQRGAKATITAMAGVTAAIGAAVLGSKALDATLGSAARREMSVVTTRAMFRGDTATADAYFRFLEQRAAESATLSQDDFFGTAKSFAAITKDLPQLQKLTGLAERLAASDPAQGLEGAALALRELASGDGLSLVERFEMPRSEINIIKELPLDKQIDALDKLLEKQGFTNELIGEQGRTALGQYNQAVDKLRMGLQRMGVQALDKIKPQLERFNRALDGDGFKRFVDVGSTALTGLVNASISGFNRAQSAFQKYMDTLNADEEWANLTWDEKLTRVIDDAFKALNKWLDESPTVKLLTDKALEYGTSLGIAIGKGMLQGVTQFAAENPLLAAFLGGGWLLKNGKIPFGKGASDGKGGGGGGGKKSLLTNPYVIGATGVAATTGYVASTWEKARMDGNSIYSSKALGGGVFTDFSRNPIDAIIGNGPANASISDKQVSEIQSFMAGATKNHDGLNYVPRDNYPALLHKGERVQTKAEADQMRRGPVAAGAGVTINVNEMHVRSESDIDAIAAKLAHAIMNYNHGMVAY